MRIIEINGQQYPVKFGLTALKKMLAKYKLSKLVDVEKLMADIEPGYLPTALKLGIDNGCRIEGTEPPTQEAINEAFDNDLSLVTVTIDLLSKDLTGEPEQAPDEKKDEAEPGPVYKR